MKISVKNLGALEEAEFELGDMTIICGKNNTGKTYATYALFGFLSFWREMFSIRIPDQTLTQLFNEGAIRIDIKAYQEQAARILEEGCRAYVQQLAKVFASSPDRFKQSGFWVNVASSEFSSYAGSFERKMSTKNGDIFSITKEASAMELVVTFLIEKEKVKIPKDSLTRLIGDALKEIIFGHLFPNPFIASAERTGAAIFRRELNFTKNRMLEEVTQKDKNLNPLELLFKVFTDYALPVKTNVEFTRQLESISKKKSFIAENHPEILTNFFDIIGGDYTVTRNDELFFVPQGKRVKLTMDESSSAVRSLLDVGFYLRHVAQPGDLLMVDEPELNLHPENQRRVARLFAHLLRAGLKVFITTHSDYIIKELNTLIMLNQPGADREAVRKRYGYEKEEPLAPERIRVYIAEQKNICKAGHTRKSPCQTLTPADIDPVLGIEARSFDETIDEMNQIQEALLFAGENGQ